VGGGLSAEPVVISDWLPDPEKPNDLPQFSEENLALRFSEQQADNLRYVAAWGKWMRWSGHRWRPDDTLNVFDASRAICRAAAAEVDAEHKSTAVRLASAKTVAAIEHLARCDRRHAATIDQWDSDLWILNTPAGVLDLRTGNLRPAARADYVTKSTAVRPGGACPLWLKFLDRITNGDQSLQRFMQRMAGYFLTGVTHEHALFFFYGTGGNGKGVFINTISGILDSYAKTAPIEAFITSKVEHHPTDFAGLQGARLATVTETEEGRQWAEAKIKALTGGDRISARFMRQDFFEFVPQFKLLIAGNHKPGLRTVDEAIRRRFHLLPFTITIPVEERDLGLTEKLRAEWPGILQWAVDGCLEWQRSGLAAPEAVRTATDRYLAAEDSLAAWIDDECVLGREHWSSTRVLFGSWTVWAERNHEHTGSQKRFIQKLEARGMQYERNKTARGFRGLTLKEDA
jgi:putative DNA primase/helicase